MNDMAVIGIGFLLAANACANLSAIDNRYIEAVMWGVGCACIIIGMALLLSVPL